MGLKNLKNMTPEDKQSFIQHLEAFRKAIIISVIAIVIGAAASFSYSDQILKLITGPLGGQKLIVTGITEAFWIKLQLSFLAGFVIAFPVVAWAMWGFIKPALYPHERRYIYILFPLILLLFAGGAIFAFKGILPIIINVLIFIAKPNLEPMLKVDEYVSFVMSFVIPFGLVFEMPVIAFFLAKIGIIKYEWMAKHRRHALLVIVIIAAALTPGPDPFSQMMMAAPMYLLYEVSIWVSKYARRKKEVEPVLE